MQDKNEIWLPRLVQRITYYFFIQTLIIFVTFVIGNFQGFLDSTQLLLLGIFRVTSLLYIVSGIYRIIIALVFVIKKEKGFITGIILTVSGEIFIIVLFLIVNMIMVLTKSVQ